MCGCKYVHKNWCVGGFFLFGERRGIFAMPLRPWFTCLPNHTYILPPTPPPQGMVCSPLKYFESWFALPPPLANSWKKPGCCNQQILSSIYFWSKISSGVLKTDRLKFPEGGESQTTALKCLHKLVQSVAITASDFFVWFGLSGGPELGVYCQLRMWVTALTRFNIYF